MNTEFFNQVFIGNTVKAYIFFFSILIIGLIFKRLFSKLLSNLLFRLFKRVHTNTDPTAFTALLIKPVEFLLLLVILYSAINQLEYPLQEVIFRRKDYQLRLIQVFDKVFLFSFIVGFFWTALRLLDFIGHVFLYKASMTVSKSDDQMVPFVRELAKIIVIIIGVFVVLGSVFNLNVATIIAGLGIGGIAVALAAQDTLQNLLGSFAIFADKPFLVGDVIKIDNIEGTVEKVGFRSTHIRTIERTVVIIPNKKMVDTPVENLSLRNYFRVRFEIALNPDISNQQLTNITSQIKEFINSQDDITDDTLVNFESFGNATVNLQILYYISVRPDLNVAEIKEGVYYKVRQIVNENQASFAIPSQLVYHEYPEKAAVPNQEKNNDIP